MSTRVGGGAGRRAVGWSLAVLCAVAFVVFSVSPVRQNYDSYLSFPTAYSMVHERSLDLSVFDASKVRDHYANVEGPDGRRVNFFPWAGSLWLVPAVAALDVAGVMGVGPGAYEVANGGPMDVIQVVVASAILAVALGLVGAAVLDRLTPELPRRRLVALLVVAGLAFGTPVWSVASRALWQHTPALLALAAAIYFLQRMAGPAVRRRPALAAGAGVALASAYTFRPTNGLTIVALSVYVLVRHRRLVVPYLAGRPPLPSPGRR